MIGIIVSDYELLLKKNEAMLEEVKNDIAKLQDTYLNLDSTFTSKELNFFNEKLGVEVNQLNNILKKLDGYQNSLKSVYMGYQKQYEQAVRNSKNLIS